MQGGGGVGIFLATMQGRGMGEAGAGLNQPAVEPSSNRLLPQASFGGAAAAGGSRSSSCPTTQTPLAAS